MGNNMIPFPAPPRMAQQDPAQGRSAAVNPMQMIVNRFVGGMSPMAILDQMGGPQVQQAKKIIGGKSESQLRSIAQNMAQQRGINLDDLAQQLGVRLPK